MIRFIHASDLHLGRRFGTYPEDVRVRLRRARQDSIGRLAAVARDGGATHILLAGDTFDAETPQPTTIRHALNAMAADPALTWVLMPGNHDSLAASELWRVLATDHPANVLLAITAEPVDLGPAILLPAPCTVRHPGRDLTEWMDEVATGEAIRIGLAHGGVRDFSSREDQSEVGNSAVIAPDRAEQASLDYLGLGDWHGRIKVGPATWYSGTPEADSFKPHRPAGVLMVTVGARGASPDVVEIETGSISWRREALELLSEDDAVRRHGDLMPELGVRADMMFDLIVSGRMTLRDRLALEQDIARSGPDFLWHQSDLSGVSVLSEATDLDLISDSGALRRAAETLAADSKNSDDPARRKAAATALSRLFTYAMEDE
jgi:DNA repair exonuclease SbcCD nuclease subunit